MKRNEDIPTHRYEETIETIQNISGIFTNSNESQLPFALTTYEQMNQYGQADYPHRHDCYEIVYLYGGEGEHVIDFESYPIRTPMFYFLSKDQVHFWQLKKALKGYVILVPEEFLGFPSSNLIRGHDFSFFHNVGQTPYLSIEKEDLQRVHGLFEGMEQEFQNETQRSMTVLRSYLHILLTQLHRLYIAEHPNEHSADTSSMVRQFKQLVSEHFLTDHSVQDYALKIGVSTSHLRDTVKDLTGVSPGTIIRNKLVLEAKRQLAHGETTVSEIGYGLNFEDASYFGRFFKRETGMSPIAFREHFRKQYRFSP